MIVIIGVIGFLLIVGLVMFSLQPKVSPSPTQKEVLAPSPTPTPQPEIIQLDLASQGASGVTGTAKIQEMNGKVNVVVSLLNDTITTSHPAHFHTGTCIKPGPIKYALTDVKNGTSTTELAIDLSTFKLSLPLILNIHKSAQQISSYIACGNVNVSVPPTTPGSS